MFIDDVNLDMNKTLNKRDNMDLSMISKALVFVPQKLFQGCLLIAKKSEVP